ncbi:hypothetical protein [Viscerimonas tarda]
MKHVVSNAMVAHLWAHQSQDNARTGDRRFYFEEKDIYSYGSHFRCASVVENPKGESAYLITTRTYSSSTRRHIQYVRSAIPHNSRIFYTARKVTAQSGKLDEKNYQSALFYIIDQLKSIDTCIAKQTKARLQDYSGDVRKSLTSISRWISFWGLDKRQKSADGKFLPPVINALLSGKKSDIDAYWMLRDETSYYSYYTPVSDESRLQGLLKLIADAGLLQSSANNDFDAGVLQLFNEWSGNKEIWLKFNARRQRQFDALQKQREEEERVCRMTFEQRRVSWKQGNTAIRWIDVPSSYGFNTILRVRKGNVETSKGITIAPAEAVRLWSLVHRFHENETEFHKDVVHDSKHNKWAISSYRNDILTAGCHSIAYAEMQEIAEQLGLAA